MAGKRVDIEIKTTADTSGVDKLDKALQAQKAKQEAAAKKAADAEAKEAKKAADAAAKEAERARKAIEKAQEDERKHRRKTEEIAIKSEAKKSEIAAREAAKEAAAKKKALEQEEAARRKSTEVAAREEKRKAENAEREAKRTTSTIQREEKRKAQIAENEASRVAAAQKRAAKQAEDAANRQRGAKSRNVGNMALQLGDVFTQVGGGTDVMRALSMQLPQMMGTSMAGAIAGAAFAAAGPVIEMIIQKMQDGMDKASKEALASMKENAKDLQKAFGEEAFASQQRALDAIIKQYRTINDETKANIDLNIELANLADERANAADETRIAEIEASKASDPEKQRQILAVRERIQSRAMTGARRAGLGQAQVAASALTAAQGEQYTLGAAAVSAREQERIAYDRFRQNRAAAEAFQRVQGAEATLSRMRNAQGGGDVLTAEQEQQRKAAIAVIRRDAALAKSFDPSKDPERNKDLADRYKQARERRIEAETKAATAAEEVAKLEAELARAKSLDAERAKTESAKLEEARRQADIERGKITASEAEAKAAELAKKPSSAPTAKPIDVLPDLSNAGSSVFGALSGIDMPSAGKTALTTAAENLTRNPSDKTASVMESTLEKLIDYMKRTNQASDAQYARILKLEREIETLRQRNKQNTLAK